MKCNTLALRFRWTLILKRALLGSGAVFVMLWCSDSEMEEEVEFQEFKRAYLKGMMDDEDEDGNVSGGDEMMPKEK